MFKITRTGIFCLSITIMFILAQIFINQYLIQTEINEEIMNMEILEEKISSKVPSKENEEKNAIWQIEISKIDLKADISEGTTKEILNQYVGHFDNTSKQQGNICLAAQDYFKDLKMLKEGDEIKYKHNEFEKIYEVEKCRIIKDTEWKYLEATEENILTLITYVENQPEYRRCVQAVEKSNDDN